MLGKSCDQLPYNIMFVLDDDEGCPDEVIGHSRLCRVHGEDKSCFVESVVIKKTHRGKGYGGKLMRETEEHARKLGFEVAYLTTHDKVDFYSHVGYAFCQPVVSLGSASTLLSDKMLNKLFGKMSMSFEESCSGEDVIRSREGGSVEDIIPCLLASSSTPPCILPSSPPLPSTLPPPPPLLASFPPPPPLPSTLPHPPPLPATIAIPTAKPEAIDAPHSPRSGNIHWMKKSLVLT